MINALLGMCPSLSEKPCIGSSALSGALEVRDSASEVKGAPPAL